MARRVRQATRSTARILITDIQAIVSFGWVGTLSSSALTTCLLGCVVTLRSLLLLALRPLVATVCVAPVPLLVGGVLVRLLRAGPELLRSAVVVPARVGHCYRVSHSSVTTIRQVFTDLDHQAAAAHDRTPADYTARLGSCRTWAVPAGNLDEPS